MGEISNTFKLTMKQRMYGFGACFVFGLLCTLLSTVTLVFLKLGAFGLLYSLGNISAIMSTMFLLGPMKQLKNMFQLHRAIATVIFIISIALTLMAALWWKNVALTVIFMIIQFCALFWYCLSYIPFGRDIFKKCCGSMAEQIV